MRSARHLLLALALGAVAIPATARAAANEDNFLVRNTGDLAALCSPSGSGGMDTAATHFCQGFMVGVFRVLNEIDTAYRTRDPLFCVPNPAPSRNQAIASFVQWAQADPSRSSMPATDGVAAFLASSFPCHRGS